MLKEDNMMAFIERIILFLKTIFAFLGSPGPVIITDPDE